MFQNSSDDAHESEAEQMTLGTFVVSAILVVIVAVIIISMVRSHKAGKHVGCDGCGACGSVGGDAVHCVSHGSAHDFAHVHHASASSAHAGVHGAHGGAHGTHGDSCACSSVEDMIARMNADLAKRSGDSK